MHNPMCELFPKQVACYYSRYGMGGGLDSRHGMCILGLNMINDKAFLLIWFWNFFLVFIGVIRITTRSSQLSSAKVRFFLLKFKMARFFKNNAHMKHIQHYIYHCSIGDWFVLYQMSKNLNKPYFAKFIALLAMTVDPDPSIEPEEPTIHLSPEDIEKIRSSSAKDKEFRESDSSEDNSSAEDDEEKKPASFLMKLEGDLDTDGAAGGGGGGGITGKQRMLIKLGKHAKSANKSAMMAAAAMKRSRRK